VEDAEDEVATPAAAVPAAAARGLVLHLSHTTRRMEAAVEVGKVVVAGAALAAVADEEGGAVAAAGTEATATDTTIHTPPPRATATKEELRRPPLGVAVRVAAAMRLCPSPPTR
jgi:hypothetical protein